MVPSGALTSLPFQVLVTEKPTGTGSYADATWLTRHHAITVLPSAASLKALRQFAKATKATRPFVGFGNPLLVGPSGADRSAWTRQSCAKAPELVRVASRAVRAPIAQFFRGHLADADFIRRQQPLPETTDELCAVAQSVGAAESAIYLGDKATERVVKSLSADGTLAQARVVHFATHGLLGSETQMFDASKAEPALLLTPPNQPNDEDDGLLTASEAAVLKLDADWVVLSACNTAAGDGNTIGAEALSGLARAFFYAGARALLVSHWAVDFECYRQPNHQGVRRDQGRRSDRPRRGVAPFHAGPDWNGWRKRPPRHLGAVRRGRRRGALTVSEALAHQWRRPGTNALLCNNSQVMVSAVAPVQHN